MDRGERNSRFSVWSCFRGSLAGLRYAAFFALAFPVFRKGGGGGFSGGEGEGFQEGEGEGFQEGGGRVFRRGG